MFACRYSPPALNLSLIGFDTEKELVSYYNTNPAVSTYLLSPLKMHCLQMVDSSLGDAFQFLSLLIENGEFVIASSLLSRTIKNE